METLNVSISENMQQWIDARVKAGAYLSASDYLYDLILKDKQRDEIREALIAGENSGISNRKVKDIIAESKALLQK